MIVPNISLDEFFRETTFRFLLRHPKASKSWIRSWIPLPAREPRINSEFKPNSYRWPSAAAVSPATACRTSPAAQAACWCGTAAGVARGLGTRIEAAAGGGAESASPCATAAASPGGAGVATPAPQSLEWDAIYNAINHGVAEEPEKAVQQIV